MEEKLSIANWAEEDRPREKMRDQGAETLSKAELLAILIGSGSTKKSAVELMKDVLHDCDDNLNALGKMTINQLMRYNGIGEAKAITCSMRAGQATGTRESRRARGHGVGTQYL